MTTPRRGQPAAEGRVQLHELIGPRRAAAVAADSSPRAALIGRHDAEARVIRAALTEWLTTHPDHPDTPTARAILRRTGEDSPA